MLDWKFNKHKFYNQGFNIGFIPNNVREQCIAIIKETNWIGDKPAFADWATIPNDINELFFEELIRTKMTYGQAPTAVKNLANSIIDLDFFNPLKQILVKKQYANYNAIRNIKPVSMSLWNKQADIPFHNDISDTSDFFVLIYINDYETWDESWNGQLNIGVEREDGHVELMHSHYPSDSTFVMVNNMNPLFKHEVVSAGDKDRYSFGFRYVIE